jgi:hypothetical protein
MLIYLPLEHIDARYTSHLDKDICKYLNNNGIPYHRIYPDIPSTRLKNGTFLDASFTIDFKARQISQIAKMYANEEIKDGDTIFCSDLWMPGIESIAYLNYFCKKNVRLTGIIHAGSFTDTDFVRDMERWAKNFEDIILDISSEIYVASNFIRNDLIKKRFVHPDKVIVSGLPLDSVLDEMKDISRKEDIVIFNGRNVGEKQPELFERLRYYFPNVTFINTQKEKLSKKEYYDLLSRSKVVVSFALQENFGYGINEAVKLGCIPVVPNRLVYPEFYSEIYRYDTFTDCIDIVRKALDNELPIPVPVTNNSFKIWFDKVR